MTNNPKQGTYKFKQYDEWFPIAIITERTTPIGIILDGYNIDAVDPNRYWYKCRDNPISEEDYNYYATHGKWR